MGTIKTQTVKGSIYSYLGVLVGFIATVLLQPKILSDREIGLLRVIIAYATIVLPFCNLGFTNAALRFFPYFRNPEKHHNGFMFLFLAVTIVGCSIGVGALFLAKDYFISETDAALFNEYAFGIIFIAISFALFGMFDTYSRLLFDSVSGRFLKEFFTRILMLIAVMCLLFFDITFEFFFGLWLIANCLPTLLLFLKLYFDGNINFRPDFSLLEKPLVKQIAIISFFAILSNSSSVIIQQIDGIMIAKYLNLAGNGIFSVTMYFGIVIAMPMRSVQSIAATQVSENWKSGDVTNIAKMYKSSCLYLTIIGTLLFIGIWVNIDNILAILPPQYAAGKYVIFFMGIGAVIDMATGLNGVVLVTSKYYRIDTYFILALIGLTVGLNYLLIPKFQIVGVAIAYAISLFTINLFRFLFVWRKFNMQPYTVDFFKVIFAALIAYFSMAYWPAIPTYIWKGIPLEDVLFKSVGVLLIFIVLIMQFSLTISELVKMYYKQAKMKIYRGN